MNKNMAKKTVGMIFHIDCDKADEVIDGIQQDYDINLIHVQQSYGRLRITKEEE